jgi:hypothetical protein
LASTAAHGCWTAFCAWLPPRPQWPQFSVSPASTCTSRSSLPFGRPSAHPLTRASAIWARRGGFRKVSLSRPRPALQDRRAGRQLGKMTMCTRPSLPCSLRRTRDATRTATCPRARHGGGLLTALPVRNPLCPREGQARAGSGGASVRVPRMPPPCARHPSPPGSRVPSPWRHLPRLDPRARPDGVDRDCERPLSAGVPPAARGRRPVRLRAKATVRSAECF